MITYKELGIRKVENDKITIDVPHNIPSIPSIKLKKLIIPVRIIIANIMNMKLKKILKLLSWLNKVEFINNINTVINWVINLNFLLQFFISSNKPTILKGKKYKIVKSFMINDINKVDNIKLTPPALGFVILWELLEFGTSGTNLVKGFIKKLVKKKLNKKLKIKIINISNYPVK